MIGAIPPLPNTSSWRGAQLKHGDKFTFSSYWKTSEICTVTIRTYPIISQSVSQLVGTGIDYITSAMLRPAEYIILLFTRNSHEERDVFLLACSFTFGNLLWVLWNAWWCLCTMWFLSLG